MKLKLLLPLCFCIFLAACKPSTAPTATHSPTESPTIQNTPIPSFTGMASATIPHRTKTISPPPYTPTPSLTPTHTAIAVISPFPTVPPIEKAANVRLQNPNPHKLIELAIVAMQKSGEILGRYFPMEFDKADPSESNLLNESTNVLDFIAGDLRRYYPDGFPEMNIQVADRAADLRFWSNLPDWINAYLDGWIINTINNPQTQFEAGKGIELKGAIIQPYAIEIDNDPGQEWLVDVRIDREAARYSYYTWLLLDQDSDGSYHVLHSDIATTFHYADYEMNPYVQVDASHDLNGDGVFEIVLSEISYMAGGNSGSIFVYSWDGSTLKFVDSFRLPSVNPRYAETNESTYEITDVDGNGRDNIRISWPRFASFGCAWVTTYTYHWDGQKFVKNVANEDVPTDNGETGCYITKALWSERPEEKTTWFTAAMQSLTQDASPDLAAWVYLRLMAAYLGQDQVEQAEQVLQQLAVLPGEGNFIQAVRQAISSSSSPSQVCETMYTQTTKLADEMNTFDSAIDSYLTHEGYPLSHEPFPNRVCPWDEILFDQLLAQKVDVMLNPTDGYAAAGFELQFNQPIQLDTDLQVEWVALYQDRLTVFNDNSGYWEAKYTAPLPPISPISIQAGAADITGDGKLEILVEYGLSAPSYMSLETSCDPGESSYLLAVIDLTQDRFSDTDVSDLSCYNKTPPDLSTEAGVMQFIALAKVVRFDENQPDWVRMVGLPDKSDTHQTIYEYVKSIEIDVLSGLNLGESSSRIVTLLDYIPPHDVDGASLIRELRYLLGLSYEFAGDSENAIAAYKALIDVAPQSAWSWLAWTRLTVSPP